MDGLADQPHHPLFDARVRETEQSLDEFSGLEDLDVPKVDLDVVEQLLQEISGVHPSNFKLYIIPHATSKEHRRPPFSRHSNTRCRTVKYKVKWRDDRNHNKSKEEIILDRCV